MRLPFLATILSLLIPTVVSAEHLVGVAEVDITPDYPVRLSGFGFRRAESEGVTHRIWAKAIAFDAGGDGASAPAVILCVDNLAVPAYMTNDVAARLKARAKLDPTRLAVTCTHTHTAPMLKDVCPTLFGEPIPSQHQKNIDRYTRELADHLEQAALRALSDMKPARIEFGIGTVDFAVNRRTKGGPVDHDLPVLAIKDPGGKLRAVYLSYACHCVTLSNNKISGDWAGYVDDAVHKNHSGVVVLTSVGCGADSNPDSGVTGDKADVAAAQGAKIAAEFDRLLKAGLKPVTQPVAAKLATVELMFDTHPTREQWQEKAKRQDAVGYHARVQLAKLDRGETLQTKLHYPIQTWAFGDQLAIVFLPGEVVVDYSLRLKRELDRARLWVNAYSNDEPCYIPSERILKEGGYEGGDAMVYYDRPTKLSPGVEQRIIDEVHRQLPDAFNAAKSTEGVAPLSPEESRRAMRAKPGLEIELVAAEPEVTSPVAIDWGADGKLWVCEMHDYPTGLDEKWRPGGRVKFLTDADGDGRYEQATVFLDGLPFPTGVTAWGRGVLVCAAPDILYAEDTNGDGRADKVEKLFSGFATDNYQARVNSITLGLDNWLYGANGLLGGVITDHATGKTLDIRGRDFRFRPPGLAATGPLQTVAGLTQQGRVRDDWGRWFGCDNSTPLIHYPLEQRYAARNPHAPAPPPAHRPPGDFDVGRVYPVSKLLERFNDPHTANRFTSGCGLGIYRDTLLGDDFFGNAFVCEPVHNLVHRMVLTGDGYGLRQARAAGERDGEFLASADNWSRPVQVRTGPDGALYVVDMYRFLIEHPRWIQPDRLARIDVRAGSDKGRIYRVRPAGKPLRPVRDLTKLDGATLASALDSPNGTERDRVHVELLTRPAVASETDVVLHLVRHRGSSLPQVRLQAWCVLDGLDQVTDAGVMLGDANEHVRAEGLRLLEPLVFHGHMGETLAGLARDPSARVRKQLALSLGECEDEDLAGPLLAKLAVVNLADAEMRAAVLSSARPHCGTILSGVMRSPADAPGRSEWIAPLVATAAGSEDAALREYALRAILPQGATAGTADVFLALAAYLDALERNGKSPGEGRSRVAEAVSQARRIAGDDAMPAPFRESAVALLGRGDVPADELALLCRLAATAPPAIRGAAVASLRRQSSRAVAESILANWQQTSPVARRALVELLLGREEWAVALLRAVAANRVGRHELSLYDRQRLTRAGNDETRELAGDLFPAAGPAARADLLARYQSVPSLRGDARSGADLFAKHCAACHALGGVGHPVGPDLAALRDKDAAYFVQHILDPGAVVEPRFVNYLVVTKDRRVISGVIKSETDAALTLASGSGSTETVARSDVKEVRATGVSMMPEGFEAAFTPRQMADLIAFLKSPTSP